MWTLAHVDGSTSASLVKYAVTFSGCRAPHNSGQLALELPDSGMLAGIARYRLSELPRPSVLRLADAEPLRTEGQRS